VRDVDEARRQGVITEAEATELRAAADAVAAAIAVDDFAPEELAPRQAADGARRSADDAPLRWREREQRTRPAPSPLVGEGWGGR